MISEAEMKAKEVTDKKRAFEDFMSQPTIRLLVSMIPASEHKDTLNTLLQESFNSGWSGGSGNVAMSFFKAIIDRPHGFDRERDRR